MTSTNSANWSGDNTGARTITKPSRSKSSRQTLDVSRFKVIASRQFLARGISSSDFSRRGDERIVGKMPDKRRAESMSDHTEARVNELLLPINECPGVNTGPTGGRQKGDIVLIGLRVGADARREEEEGLANLSVSRHVPLFSRLVFRSYRRRRIPPGLTSH